MEKRKYLRNCILVLMLVLTMLSLSSIYAVNVNSCQTLSANTIYNLTANINNQNADCFIFGGDNILFDCNNLRVDGQNNGEAFTTNNNQRNNISIINCDINDFSEGIRIRNSNNINIKNTTINSPNNYGMRLDYLTGNTNVNISNVSITSVSREDAIYINQGRNFYFNDIYIDTVGNGNGDYGFYLYNVSNVEMQNLDLRNIRDEMIRAQTNAHNYTIEDVFMNRTISTAGDMMYFGYDSSNISIKNVSAYQIQGNGFQFYQNVTNVNIENVFIDYVRSRVIYCEDNGVLGCENSNFRNFLVNRAATTDGVYVERSSNSIFDNITISQVGNGNNDQGIHMRNSSNINLTKISISNTARECMYVETDSTNLIIKDSNFTNCGNDGLEFIYRTHNVTIENVNIINTGLSGTTDAIRFTNDAQNPVLRNIFINGSTDDGIELNRNNDNLIADNIQIYNVNDMGMFCEDSNVNGCPNATITNILIDTTNTDDAMYFERSSNSKFENITLNNIGNGGSGDYAFQLIRSANSTVKNLIGTSLSEGIRVTTNSYNNTYENINLDMSVNYGFYVATNSGGNIFRNITIDGTTNDIMVVTANSPNNVFEDITLSNGVGTGSSGVIIGSGCDNNSFTNIDISDVGDFGIYIDSSNTVIDQVNIVNAGDDAIQKRDGDVGLNVTNAYIENVVGYGLFIGHSNGQTILENITMNGVGQDGLYFNYGGANSIFKNIYIDLQNNLAGFDGAYIYQAYDSIFDNITILNSNNYGLHFRDNHRSNLTNIYVNNTNVNHAFYNQNSDNITVTNLTSNNGFLAGIYSTGADNSNWFNINASNNGDDGIYFRYPDYINITNLTSKNNVNYGAYFRDASNVNLTFSDTRNNGNLDNLRLSNVNGFTSYFNFIGRVTNNNWAQNSIWNTTTNVYSFGNYWQDLVCQESIYLNFDLKDWQVCVSDNFTLNSANNRIDHGPIYDNAHQINISFENPTPLNNSITCSDCILINVSEGGHLQRSSYLDFNETISHYYDFENTSGLSIYDKSDNSNTGIRVNSPTINSPNEINSIRGQYIDFNGIDQYVSNANIFNTLRDTSTLSFWIKTNQTGSNTMWQAPGVTGIEESGAGDDIFWGWIDASGRIGVLKGNTNGAQSTTAINDGNWHHVVLMWNSTSGLSLAYVDGVLEDFATTETGIVGNSFSSIGRIEDTGGTPEYFDGYLDEVVIYDRMISLEEVRASYNSNYNNLIVNISGLSQNETYNFKAYNINLMGNNSQTERRYVTLSNNSANVTVNSPSANVTKLFDTDTLLLSLTGDTVMTNVRYYIDGDKSNNYSMTNSVGFTWIANLTSNLSLGYHNITFMYYAGCGILEETFGGDIYIIKNSSVKQISKNVKFENVNLYKVEMVVQNVFGDVTNITNLDFVSNDFISGSWSPLFNFSNVVGAGTLYGWNQTFNIGESKNVNHSISGVGDHKLRREFLVGLD